MRKLVLAAVLVLAGCGQASPESGRQPSASEGSTPTTSEVAVTPGLSPHGKDVIARAKRAGETAIGLTIATERGATDRAAETLRQMGATVEATDATIGYLRVSVPIDLAERVPSVDGVTHVDVDEPLSNIDPTP